MFMLMKNWKQGFVEGILLLLLGLIGLTYPYITTLSFSVFFGLLILISGAALTFRARGGKESGDLVSLCFGAITTTIGLLMVFYPGFGAATLTLIIVFYFLLDGIGRLATYFRLPKFYRPSWLLPSALLSLAVALVIWVTLPSVSLWLLGVIVGLHLCLSGAALSIFSLSFR